jgi:hypothetical protein
MVGLSDQDMKRIRKFNETPWYAKDPEILVPADGDEESSRAEASD